MKKLMPMLLSCALCLCLLKAPGSDLVNGCDWPSAPEVGTEETENPDEPLRPLDDDFPGEWDSTID